jgi:hypothetical protein
VHRIRSVWVRGNDEPGIWTTQAVSTITGVAGRARQILTQDAGDPTQKVERDVDEQIRPAAALEHDGDERDEDGEEVQDYI